MVVGRECAQRLPQVRFAEDHQAVETFVLDGADKSSSAGESHPRALSEPYVKLSLHTAPTTQPPASRRAATGQRAAGPVARCAPASAWTHALDAEIVCISAAPRPRAPHADGGARAHTSTGRNGRSRSPTLVPPG